MFKKVSVLVLVSAMVFGDMAPAFAKKNKKTSSAKKQRAASVKKNVKKGKVEVDTTATVEKVEESVPEVESAPTPAPAPVEAKAEPVILQPIINVNPVIDVPANIVPSANVLVEQKKAKETLAKVKSDLQAKLSNAQSSCSGIKSNLDSIFGLSVATTVSSGLGTLAAGSALAVGIMKSKTDKKYEENNELLTLWNKAITSGNVEDAKAFDEKIDEINRIISSGEQSKLEKKSKTLGNVRTGLMAGATATSAVSTGTSIGAVLSATKLAEKMSDCNNALKNLKLAKATAEAEELEASDPAMAKAGEILSACTGYDEGNIKSLKNLATANAVVSGIGTATAGAGTITSAMANSKKVRDDDSEAGKKKEKNLNLASNILAGVTTGTSGASTALSAVQISKAKKDSDMAEKCEKAL